MTQDADDVRDAWDCNCPGNTPHDHLFKSAQHADTVAMTYDEAAIRKAVYAAYFDVLGGDEQDPLDIQDADAMCVQVLWRLRHSDGGVTP